VRFVSYNIQFGRGKDGRIDLERTAAAVRGADVIGLQEVERNWSHLGEVDQAARLGELLGDYYWVYGAGLDVDGSMAAPDGKVTNRRRQVGNMLLARRPVLASRTHLLPRIALLDMPNDQRVAVEGVIANASGPIRVYVTHLSPRSNRERQIQAEWLRRTIQEAPAQGGVTSGPNLRPDLTDDMRSLPSAAVLMGDLNFEPHHAEYALLAGAADFVYGRVAETTSLVDTWVRTGHGEDEGVTCPRDPANDTHHDCRIDYGFVTADLAGRVRRAWIDSAAQGSDHQPIWFELDL
jgi:endonuclease/exonuclease/phosphatase family metal-dependent hydrolase